jgi:hypothetical protein
VTWTNYRVSRAYPYYTPVGSGVAARTTNWAVTNLALFPGYANRIIVTGTGTSWNAALGGVTTFNRTLTVIFPPFITLQPQSQTVNQGDPVSFSLSVTTLAPPVQYQWRFDGTNMVGTTNATLGLSHAQLTNAGLYSVVVSNQFGALISSNAVLAVNQIPIARCADVVVSAGPGCVAYASVDNGSFDPDGDAITLSQSPPGPYPLGTNEVVLTAIDSKGASNSCRAR